MNPVYLRLRATLAFASVFGFVAIAACSSDSNPGAANDSGPPTPDAARADTGPGTTDSGLPQCASSQACVGYPSFGDWTCLERCDGDADTCPSGTTCQSVSGCCTGTGCSAVSNKVCVASASDAATDAPSDAPDADGGFPQCTSSQACVGYPSFGDWTCLERCDDDASVCPSGTTCKADSGCCIGTACSAPSVKVCEAP